MIATHDARMLRRRRIMQRRLRSVQMCSAMPPDELKEFKERLTREVNRLNDQGFFTDEASYQTALSNIDSVKELPK